MVTLADLVPDMAVLRKRIAELNYLAGDGTSVAASHGRQVCYFHASLFRLPSGVSAGRRSKLNVLTIPLPPSLICAFLATLLQSQGRLEKVEGLALTVYGDGFRLGSDGALRAYNSGRVTCWFLVRWHSPAMLVVA